MFSLEVFMSLSTFGSVAADAASCGAVCTFSRPSPRSLSGWVCVCCFFSSRASGAFAAVAGRALPSVCCGCRVRPVSPSEVGVVLPVDASLPAGGLWGVSVPCVPCSASFVPLVRLGGA